MNSYKTLVLLGAAVFVLTGIGAVFAQSQTPAGSQPAPQVQTPPPVPATPSVLPPSPAQPPKGKGCTARFDQMDTDHDGRLSSAEYMAVPHPRLKKPEERFKKWDTNNDGVLSKDEFCTKSEKQGEDVE
jgi:hypothetical protein